MGYEDIIRHTLTAVGALSQGWKRQALTLVVSRLLELKIGQG
jgi:hypothetical protein